jgi:stage II sporulation protein AA (anti-sigma F factor antagonist)
MTARVETRTEGGSIHIALSGEIDLANAATVENELRAAISHQSSAVLIDLTNLTYMDSVGIRILFALVSRLNPLQTMPTLIVPLEAPTRRLIEIAGFETVVCLRPESH